jgi:CBS domain-containing protein
MSRFKISSLVLLDNSGIPAGIITDRDLRDKVVARGLDFSGPVSRIMSPPLIRVDSLETCFEALVKMVQFNVHHLLVVEEGQLKGIVTNHDFMLLQGTSPLSLVKFIENQKHVEGLLTIHEKINQIISLLFKEGVRATHIIRIITELNDRLLKKIIDLSIYEIGDSPLPFSFVLHGSEGRKEQTFKTDFDCIIIYDDPATPFQDKEMEEYSQRLLSYLQDVFTKCGLPRFNPAPLGKQIYGSISSWKESLVPALRSSTLDVALKARKLLDMRPIYGESMLVKTLRESVFAATNENRTYIATFLDWNEIQNSPLGFFKQFVVDRGGEHKDKLNIKEKGILPIVDALRIMAVAFDIPETSTIERLNALSRPGKILAGMRDDITSAFDFLLHLSLQDQLRKTQYNEKIDDFIEPEELSLLEKKTLKEVFQLIPRLHTAIEDYYLKRDTIAI